MIAYRLGELPSTGRSKELEQLPLGPRINLTDAQQLMLPDGTLFSEASEEQIIRWFEYLFRVSGDDKSLLDETLTGLDLTDFDDRWWALNEVLETGGVRDVLAGKPRKTVNMDRLPDAINHKQLVCIVGEYGLGVTNPKKPDGTAQVYAQMYRKTHRYKIYICALSQLGNGQVTERKVRHKLEKRGLSVLRQQDGRVV